MYSLTNDARLVVLMTMVLVSTLDTNVVVTEAGDAMGAIMIVKGSPKDVSKSSGRSEDSESKFRVFRTRDYPNVACCGRTTQSECDRHLTSVVVREKRRDPELNRIAKFLFGVKSCKSCLYLSARKASEKLRDASFWCANPGKAFMCKVSMAVSETNDMSHNLLFFLLRRGCRGVPIPRGMEIEIGSGSEQSSRIAS